MSAKRFTGLQIFKLKQPFVLSAVELHEKLSQSKFKPAGQLEWSSVGWVPPLEGLDTLTLPIRDTIFFTMQEQKKMLPQTVIRDEIKERVAVIESEQNRRAGKREKAEIAEKVIGEFLPRAFPRNSEITGYIDLKNNWLIVNTSNRKKAEDVISLLRLDLDGLEVVPPTTDSIADRLTHWLVNENLPDGFGFGYDCKLIDPDDSAESVVCKQLDLLSEEVSSHLSASKQVIYLGLQWREKLIFILDDELSIRRVSYLGDSGDADNITTDLALMTGLFTQFIPQLLNALKVTQ